MTEKTKILVVDDDPLIVKATRRLLEKAGYQTFPAHTGQEALEVARAHHPDLILLDVNMPDMNGFDACRQLKADPDLADIGVIIVTSTYTDGESQAAGLDLGADGYIARPVSNRELLARIQALLRTRAAEQQAQHIAAEWQATFDAVHSAIFLTDEHFTILKCNRTAEALFQASPADIIGKKCYHLVHGTDKPIAACPLAAVRAEKQRQSLTFEQGSRWLEVTVDPVLDEDGKFIGSVHVVNDITERKHMEEVLQLERDRAQCYLDIAGVILLALDAEARIILINRKGCEILGYSEKELLGRNWIDTCLPPNVRDEVKAVFKSIMSGAAELSSYHENRVLTKNGKERLIAWHNVALTDKSGKLIGTLSSGEDITERKQAEQALRESEERLAGIIETVPSGIAIVNREGQITFANPAAEATLGLTRSKITQRRYNDPDWRITAVDGSPFPDEELPFVRVMQSGQPVYGVEHAIEHPDGRRVILSINAAPIKDSSHQTIGMIAAITDITERRQTEQALRESEASLRRQNALVSALLENLRIGVFMVEAPSGKPLIANEAAKQLLGQGILPDASEKNLAEVYRARKQGSSKPYPTDEMPIVRGMYGEAAHVDDMIVTRPDGSEILLDVFGTPIRDESGKVWASLVSFYDITERKRVEEALRESKERSVVQRKAVTELVLDRAFAAGNAPIALRRVVEVLSASLNVARSSVWVLDENASLLRCLALYEAAQRVHSSGSVLRAGDFPHYFQAIQAESRIRAEDAQNDPRTSELTEGYLKPLGITSMLDAGIFLEGKLAGVVCAEHVGQQRAWHPDEESFISTMATLVAELFLNEQRKQAEEALRESEERHRAISEFISDYAYSFRVEADNRLVREWVTAESFTRLTGYTPQEIDERGGWPSLIYPEDMPIAQARARRLFAGQHDVSEFRIVRKDGSIRWLRDHGHPIVDETQGRVIRIYGAAQDITDRKQREDEIRRLNAELEARVEERTRQLKEAQEQLVRQEKLAVLGQLAGGVGHELRNPLAVISNAVYFLKLVLPEADEKVQEYLNILERETRSAEKIISDLLDFARVKSAERQAVPAAELARRVFERYPVPENIRLVLDLPPDLPPLWVDARQIEQVLGNLVLNAYQAMPSGGQLSVISRQPSVTDESLITDHCLLITVKDTGPGIPPENMKKLFEPLFTTKSHGIGLGLAVSRKLVEANGGRIEVESEPGKGAAFTLILPTVKEEK